MEKYKNKTVNTVYNYFNKYKNKIIGALIIGVFLIQDVLHDLKLEITFFSLICLALAVYYFNKK
tara:strand:- start:355 stop:546 length:192 start_codon:yes stop_codon:yes gene_type:complete